MKESSMNKCIRLFVFGLMLSGAAMVANAGSGEESMGVDVHYQSGEQVDVWSGSLSYGRVVVNNFEAGGAYTFSGSKPGNGTIQGLQIFGRQWFGPYPKANQVIPFLEVAGGFEFYDGSYKNTLGLGGGVGMFVSGQSELRFTLKGVFGGFERVTRMDAGYYYHF